MKIINKTQGTVLAENAKKADTVFSRLKGLLGRHSIDSEEALIITHCRSIHMVFMKFPIDVVFVDRNDKVIGLVENIKPFQMSPYFFCSSAAIELPAGKIKKSCSQKGDAVEIIETNDR